MISSSLRGETRPSMPQRGGGGGDSASTPPSSVRHQLSSRGNSDTTVNKMARGASLSRSQTRATAYSKNGSADRPEHLSSSFSRTATEEGATAAQGGEASFALGVAASRAMGGGGGGGGGGGNRRCVSDMTSSHSEYTADRRTPYTRDPLRRSRDTSVSDTPVMAERGGHGRDGPVIPKEPTAASAGGGGGASKAGGGSERERTSGYKVGEEELSLEVPGRYERMRVLGRGSFGAVTLVKDNRDSKLYAMKTLNCADKPEERVTAMAEVRLLKWLKHPSILTLFDTFLSADGRLVCLTTTYCESGDLAKIVKHASKTKSLLGEKTILGWFAQLCLGVHHLHEEKKVLHRDIKPNNVFLMDSKKIIQLGDFGLAKVINDGDKQVKAEVGTPYYTSPEMCNNQPYGFPSDVWSLGIVLFELLALDVPFRSRDVVVLVSQVMKAPPPPLPEVYSDEATALARWLLQKDPLRRPTLTQVLACQPLRRHMSSFVKNYRPMNMAERQRRQGIKDLEAQVASIIERGGDDPQIPGDVNDGCGTLSASAQDETATAHRTDSMSQPLGTEAERLGLAGVASAAAGGAGDGAAGRPGANRARTADAGVRSLSPADKTREGAAITVKTDIDGTGGACTRCGARVPCACGGGGAGGGGNTTPGRRFGSPRQSKGVRHVMSWATGGSVFVDNNTGKDGDRHNATSSTGDCITRRKRSSSGGSDAAEWDGRLRGRSSSEESLRHHDSGGQRDGGGGGEGSRDGADFRNEGRRRSRAGGLSRASGEGNSNGSDSGRSNHNAGKVDSIDRPTAHEAARPTSPRSPRSQVSARLKRVSGGSSSSAGNGGRDDDDLEGQGAPSVPPSESEPRQRESSSGQEGGAVFPRNSQQGDRATAATTPRALPNTFAPSAATDISTEDAERARENTGTSADGKLPVVTSTHPTTASLGRMVQREPGVCPVGAAGAVSSTSGARRSSQAASAPGASAGAIAAAEEAALHRLGTSPRTPRSPRMSGSGSETVKTAKRLSEALMFAAGRSETGLISTVGVRDLSPGSTPRRESSVVRGMALTPRAAGAAIATPGPLQMLPRGASATLQGDGSGRRRTTLDRLQREGAEAAEVEFSGSGESTNARERSSLPRESSAAAAAAVLIATTADQHSTGNQAAHRQEENKDGGGGRRRSTVETDHREGTIGLVGR